VAVHDKAHSHCQLISASPPPLSTIDDAASIPPPSTYHHHHRFVNPTATAPVPANMPNTTKQQTKKGPKQRQSSFGPKVSFFSSFVFIFLLTD
jgi:hypothetical protein